MRVYARHAGRPRSIAWVAGPAEPDSDEAREEAEEELDEALRETFPASDPIAPHRTD